MIHQDKQVRKKLPRMQELALMAGAVSNHHRPLLVMHRVSEGHLVFDLRIEDEQTLEVHELPSPAVPPLPYRPLAVAGNAVLGVDTAAATHHHHRDDTGPPIMVRVRQDLVVRMNTIICSHSNVSSSGGGGFEALRLLPDGHSWHVTPLPPPPVVGPRTTFSNRAAVISAYFVMGSSVWISVTGQGTFSLDAERGTWRAEFPEELRRLAGRALFVPELGNAVVGLTPAHDGDGRLLCAYRFDERGVLTWRRTWPETVPWDWFGFRRAKNRRRPATEMVDLAYMGEGRFCVCRPVEVLDDDDGSVWSCLKSLLVLEMRCSPSPAYDDHGGGPGEIELVRRGEFSVRGLWPHGQCLDLYFLQ